MVNRSVLRIAFAVGLAALFGARLDASTWYFQDTVLAGTFSGDATVNGYISVAGTGVTANFDLPVDIIITGPFGSFTDTGSSLQLDEGTGSFADAFVDFITSQGLGTTALTTVPLASFTFTSAGFPVVDTYSLVSGDLVMAPEPSTASAMLVGVLALLGAAMYRRRSAIKAHRG
jgi:hypothetical protein